MRKYDLCTNSYIFKAMIYHEQEIAYARRQIEILLILINLSCDVKYVA